MMESIGAGFTALLGWTGEFANSLLTAPASGEASLYVLLPVVGLCVGYGVLKFGVHIVKSFVPSI